MCGKISIRCYLAGLFAIGFAHGALVYGMLMASLTSIEHRFGLTSTTSGWFSSSYRSMLLLGDIVFPHVFQQKKIKGIVIGAILVVVGASVFILPEFLSEPYVPRSATLHNENSSLCPSNPEKIRKCTSSRSDLPDFFYLFIVGQLIMGLGGASTQGTLIQPLLDQDSLKHNGPFFMGLFACFLTFGVCAAFAAQGFWLQYWVNIGTNPPLGITHDDTHWVGAWWVPYIIFLVFMLITAAIVSFFPDEIDMKQTLLPSQDTEAEKSKQKNMKMPSSFISSIRALFGNPTYISHCIGFLFRSFALMGSSLYGAKHIEAVFHVSPSTASLIMTFVVPFGMLGTVFGGWIIKNKQTKSNWNDAQNAKFLFIMGLLSLVTACGVLIGCKELKLAGITHQYSEKQLNCTAECQCPETEYSPVCGDNDIIYINPCWAGCQQKLDIGSFTSCLCLPNASDLVGVKKVQGGLCRSHYCTVLTIIFSCIVVTDVFIMLTPTVSANYVVLRGVAPEHITMALGLRDFVTVLFGTIPAAILYGMIIDRTCLIHDDPCQGETNCLEYKTWDFRLYLFGLNFGARFVMVLCFGLSWYFFSNHLSTKTKDIFQSDKSVTDSNIYKRLRREDSSPISMNRTWGSNKTWESKLLTRSYSFGVNQDATPCNKNNNVIKPPLSRYCDSYKHSTSLEAQISGHGR